jgi:hypothetical protein
MVNLLLGLARRRSEDWRRAGSHGHKCGCDWGKDRAREEGGEEGRHNTKSTESFASTRSRAAGAHGPSLLGTMETAASITVSCIQDAAGIEMANIVGMVFGAVLKRLLSQHDLFRCLRGEVNNEFIHCRLERASYFGDYPSEASRRERSVRCVRSQVREG